MLNGYFRLLFWWAVSDSISASVVSFKTVILIE